MSRARFRFPESTPALLILRQTLGRCEQRPYQPSGDHSRFGKARGFQGRSSGNPSAFTSDHPIPRSEIFLRNASEFLRNI